MPNFSTFNRLSRGYLLIYVVTEAIVRNFKYYMPMIFEVCLPVAVNAMKETDKGFEQKQQRFVWG